MIESPRKKSSSYGEVPVVRKKYVTASVISLAACRDNELSEEVVVDGKRMGAFTKAFIDIMGKFESIASKDSFSSSIHVRSGV
jgi:hypothetical protein